MILNLTFGLLVGALILATVPGFLGFGLALASIALAIACETE